VPRFGAAAGSHGHAHDSARERRPALPWRARRPPRAQEFLDWAAVTTRIWRGAADLEVEWTASPLPFKDGRGRELVLRYETMLASGAPAAAAHLSLC